MRRTLLFAIGGLLLAGIIHIAVIFAVPLFATHDAWAEMRRFGRDGQFHIIPIAEAGNEPLPDLDPHFLHAVCRFSLDKGPVRVRASLPDDFWSVAVFDRRGRNIYNLNDRSASAPRLDVVVVTPVQMAQLRQDPPESLETAIVVEEPIERGFVVLRAFVADDSLVDTAIAALSTADCAGTL
jgi:uncharacterized membrane protein